jgi:hypothetical protein
MNKFLFNLCFTFLLICFIGCSKDDMQNSDNSAITGVWGLSAWNIDGGFDINNDGTVSTNLLNEIDCSRNETLIFNNKGVVSLNTTFNPDISIALLNEETSEYIFTVICDTEGVISLATSYTVENNIILFGNSEALVEDNQISITYKDRIEVFNLDFTQVLATKDLTLIYEKQ